MPHAQVDVQKHRSVAIGGEDISKQGGAVAASSLMSVANKLSDRIDSCKGNSDGLPEDRVANIVFKSARSKLERLIHALEDPSS